LNFRNFNQVPSIAKLAFKCENWLLLKALPPQNTIMMGLRLSFLAVDFSSFKSFFSFFFSFQILIKSLWIYPFQFPFRKNVFLATFFEKKVQIIRFFDWLAG